LIAYLIEIALEEGIEILNEILKIHFILLFLIFLIEFRLFDSYEETG
jgi:hypothetical protein